MNQKPTNQLTKQSFHINGMHCDACIRVITRRVKKIPNVTDVAVSLETGITDVTSERKIEKNEIEEMLKDTEYSII